MLVIVVEVGCLSVGVRNGMFISWCQKLDVYELVSDVGCLSVGVRSGMFISCVRSGMFISCVRSGMFISWCQKWDVY